MISIVDQNWCFFLNSRVLRSRSRIGRDGSLNFRFLCKSGLKILETELSFRSRSVVLRIETDPPMMRTVACGPACRVIHSLLLKALSQRREVSERRATGLVLDVKDLSDLAQDFSDFFLFRDEEEFTTFALRGLFKISERSRIFSGRKA